MSTYLTHLFFAFILALSTMITLNASYAFDEQTALKKLKLTLKKIILFSLLAQ